MAKDTNKGGREISRDGVIYTPSNRRPDDGMEETRVVRPVSPRAARTAGRKQPKRSGFTAFFVTVMFIGVLACVLVFAFAFRAFLNTDGGGQAYAPPTPTIDLTLPSATPPSGADAAARSALCLIEAVDAKTGSLRVYDADNGLRFTITTDSGTDVRDKYGNALLFGELAVGDVVEARIPGSGGAATSVRQSAQVREFRDISGMIATADFITFGNEKFALPPELICLYKGEPFNIYDTTDIDVVTVRCYKDRALFVGVSKRSGTLVIEEYPNIKNGTLEIDTSQFISLDGPKEIRVTEGRHRLVAQGSNIQPFIDEMTVDAGERYRVNLADAVLKSSFVTFSVNEADAVVSVDGREIAHTEQIALDYGEHVITAEKDGFLPFEQTVTLDATQAAVTVTLEKAAAPQATLTIYSDPEGAGVYIDGNYAGDAPVAVPVTIGTHTVAVRKAGFIPLELPLDVNIDNMSRMFVLQPEA